MWWSEMAVRRQFLRPWALLCLLSALILSSCGFRPLYTPSEADAARPVDRLAAVRIEPLPDRAGQQLHNLLRDRLNPRGQPVRPAYRLEIQLARTTEKVGIRKDETATRANLILNSAFVLRAMADDRVLYSGRVSSINSYNILDSQYPTDIARADALERGLRELSEDIKLHLAIYFSTAEGQDL